MTTKTSSISITCDGGLGRNDTTARTNLIEKLLALAKIGYIAHPFEQTGEAGTTGKTHYHIIVVSENGNPHRADELPGVAYCTRCF